MRSDYSTLALGCVVGPWRFDFTLKLCKSWTQLFWVVHISLHANFYTLNIKICMQANKHMTKSRIYIYTLNVKSKCQGSTTQPLNLKKIKINLNGGFKWSLGVVRQSWTTNNSIDFFSYQTTLSVISPNSFFPLLYQLCVEFSFLPSFFLLY